MKIFQTIPTNPFFSNRIVSHIRYSAPIILPFGYSNYCAPSFSAPAPVVSQPFAYSQSPFPILNLNSSMLHSHSNNHYGQFYSTPIPQNFYSTPQIIHYPTFHQIPTILVPYPANQTLFPEMPVNSFFRQPALPMYLKVLSEVATQTEPLNSGFIQQPESPNNHQRDAHDPKTHTDNLQEIPKPETHTDNSQDIPKPETPTDNSQYALKCEISIGNRRGILRSQVAPDNPQQAQIHEIRNEIRNDIQHIKSGLPPLPIVAKAIRRLNGDPEILSNVEQLSEFSQDERYC